MNRDEDVFADALALPLAERPAFLEKACVGDPAQRVRIAELLAGVSEGDRVMPTARIDRVVFSPEEKPGEKIGGYKLLEKIGEGGCGVVWLAEQGEPLRRQVAVKVIKLGMDTKEVIARFDAERHALAMMDHPNIAKVFDAGATATGRPFFAMELVRGKRITEFCDANNLNPTARLQLFAQVCRAIQHAHLKGIIHRDIKPSNILVAFHDGVAVPKVIDFGIAKATTGRLTDHTLYTSVEQMIGTPLYMSPEQIEPGGQDVDTRSDVYSLGVLLYELLSGCPPFDPKTLAESGLEGMRRIIRDTDPAKPSTRLGTLEKADRTAIARQRGTDPHALARILRGDLDWIVMRCLEKDRGRRYETASELARDVEHFLNNEPVTARPPSALYRFVKMAARHKVAAASLATAVAILVIVAASATGIAVRARRAERAEAQQSSRTDVTLSSRMIAEGNVAESLAFLVRAAQSNPEDHTIGPRLLSILAYRSFPQPIGKPLTFVGVASYAQYSADGRWATVLTPGSRWIWNLADGSRKECSGISSSSLQTEMTGCLTSDLRRMATGGVSGVIGIRDAESGQSVVPPLEHQGTIYNVVFSPDDRWLATANTTGDVKLWDAASGALRATVTLELSAAESLPRNSICFSPDSSRLLAVSRGSRSGVWKVPGGEAAFLLRAAEPTGFSGSGAFSPDGRLVAVADRLGFQLYESDTGARVGPRLDQVGGGSSVVFSRDGRRFATLSADQPVKVWGLSSPTKPQLMLPHVGGARSAFFTKDDRLLVTLAKDDIVRFWDASTGRLVVEPDSHKRAQGFLPARDGSEFLVFDKAGGTAQRWHAPAGSLVPRRLPAEPARTTVRVASGGREAHALYPDHVQTYLLPSLAPKGPPRLFPQGVKPKNTLVTFNGLEVFAIGVPRAGQCEQWDMRGPEPARHDLSPSDPAFGLRQIWFKPGAQRFVTLVSDNEGRRWALEVWNSGGRTRAGPTIRIPSAVEIVNALDFSPDERQLAFGLSGYGVQVWNIARGQQEGDSFPVPPEVTAVRFSPDGAMLAFSGGDWTVQIRDAKSRQLMGEPLRHSTPRKGLEFSSDSRRLITFTATEVRIWDVMSGTPLAAPMRPRLAPGEEINSAILRQHDRLVATITSRGSVQIYDSTTGQLLLEPFQASAPGFYGFEATDRYVATTSTLPDQNPSFTPQLEVWPLPPLDLRVPVPGWLLRLATATAGGTLDRFSAFREQPADAEAFDAIRRELDALPVNAPYADWGRWILADPATRPPAPAIK